MADPNSDQDAPSDRNAGDGSGLADQPVDGSPTPDPPPNVNRSHSDPRNVPGPERLGLMLLAVKDGVNATADAHAVSRRTLTAWLSDYGGSAPVRAWLQAETLGAFLRYEQALYAELVRRLPDTPNDELGMTIRKMIDARALVPAQHAASVQQPAVAAAQASVTLRVERDGEDVKVIELGTPPEDETSR